MLQFVVLATVLAAANAGFIGQPAPLAYAAQPAPLAYAAQPAPLAYAAAPVAKLAAAPVAITKTIDEEYDPNPQYSYAYDVQDSLTGDFKQHTESRSGDAVSGSYSLLEADGSRRIVDYTADPINGFNAVVHKEPAAALVKTAAIAPAPLIAKAPLAYAAAPVAKVAYAAPAAQLAYAGPLGHAKIYH